jgi:hypothetical protein
MLPSTEDVERSLATSLELALELAFGAPGAREQAKRAGLVLRALCARPVGVSAELPHAVVFARTDASLNPAGQSGLESLRVNPDDAAVADSLPCTLADLDQYAKTLSETGDVFLVYTRTSLGQHFYVKGRAVQVAAYMEPSIFAHGTHHDLVSALDEYQRKVAKHSICGYLTQSWAKTKKGQSVFAPAPEKFMRDSLWSFLRTRLSNHVVDREFTVGAKKPVDVVVDWKNALRKAFIEVKWLGRALKRGGQLYRRNEDRAVTGAMQLRDHYVEPYLQEHPDLDLVGYLALFDARDDRTVPIHYPADIVAHARIRLESPWEMNPPTS